MPSIPRLYFLFFVSVVALSLFTLDFIPLPWFDEVFFADMTHSLNKFGGLYLRFSPYYYNEEILLYGPVYFWVQLVLAKALGLKVLIFRLLNFIAGFTFLLLFRNYLKESGHFDKNADLLWLILFLDPVMQFNLHSGRMDFMALILSFSGFLVFMLQKKTEKPLISVASGLLMASGFLTTPRILFFLIPAAIYLLVCFSNKYFRALMIAFFAALVPVVIWIFYKFENPVAYIRYFSSVPIVAGHIGPLRGSASLWRYNYYFIWYLLIIFSLFIQTENWFRFRKLNREAVFFCSVILLFHFLVVEKGPYSAMIVPFYAGLSYLSWKDMDSRSSLFKIFPLIWRINLLFFFCIFLAKTGLGILNYSKTSEARLIERLPRSLLEGKKVVGSFEYYYIMNSLGCQFYGFQLGEVYHRKNFHFNNVDFDYLILTKQEAACHQMIEYSKGGRLEKIQSITMPETAGSRLAKELGAKLNLNVPDYSAEIFRNVRK
jgi:hypothetical protein